MEIERKSKAWRFFQSWWILLTFVPIMPWVAFLYISIRTKKKSWAVWSIIYAIPNFVYVSTEALEGSAEYEFLLSAATITIVVAFIHALIIRRDYLTRLEFKLVYEAERERRLAAEYGVIIESKEANLKQQSSQPVIHTQRYQTPHREKKTTTSSPNSLLNINTASEDEIADLPGVGIILAKKAVNHRDRNGNFEKLNDFFVLLELKDYEINRLLPLITISSPYTVR